MLKTFLIPSIFSTFALSTNVLAGPCEDNDGFYRCFIESDDAVMILEGVSLDELTPQLKIKIPKKIGGSIGKAIGAVTNPIKDNITAPIADAVGEVLDDAIFSQIVDFTDRLARDSHGQDFEDCVPIVTAAAAAYGSSVGGILGAAIGAGAGVPAARISCRKIFP